MNGSIVTPRDAHKCPYTRQHSITQVASGIRRTWYRVLSARVSVGSLTPYLLRLTQRCECLINTRLTPVAYTITNQQWSLEPDHGILRLTHITTTDDCERLSPIWSSGPNDSAANTDEPTNRPFVASELILTQINNSKRVTQETRHNE